MLLTILIIVNLFCTHQDWRGGTKYTKIREYLLCLVLYRICVMVVKEWTLVESQEDFQTTILENVSQNAKV